MTVLTVNSGSSSIRLAAFTYHGDTLTELANVRHALDGSEPQAVLREFVQTHGLTAVAAVAHRVVHGGAHFTTSCLLDQEVEREIEYLAPLAPLHNPTALRWIRATREVLGTGVAQVAVFDTAFFTALPEVARTYAIPHALAQKHALHRYGFHGLAHQALWSRWRELRPDVPDGGRVISFQLGAGCSVTAIDRGRPLDTSMGFSPLAGLVMATRSGDVDPGLVTFLQRVEGLSTEDMERLLNECSGLLGISGLSGDMRVLLASDASGARLAVALYCYRARKYLGAYLAVLGGADAILFGGGVGENAAVVRAGILEGLDWAGMRLDAAANAAAVGREGRISDTDSRIEAWVIPVDEARILAQEALAAITV